jgi:hypothetical protein
MMQMSIEQFNCVIRSMRTPPTSKIEHECDESRYLIATGDLLFRYYDLVENVDGPAPAQNNGSIQAAEIKLQVSGDYDHGTGDCDGDANGYGHGDGNKSSQANIMKFFQTTPPSGLSTGKKLGKAPSSS